MTTLSEIMVVNVVTVKEDETMLAAAKVMAAHKIGCVVVITEAEGYGVLTERDFLTFVVNDRRDVMDVKVQEIMTSPAVVADPALTIYEASKLMQTRGFRRLPIVEGGKLIGIVTLTDLNEALREDTIKAMRAKLDELELINKLTVSREMEIDKLKKRLEMLESQEQKEEDGSE